MEKFKICKEKLHGGYEQEELWIGPKEIVNISLKSHIFEVQFADSRGLMWRRESKPLEKTHFFLVWGVYRPLRPKSAIPHPITIQNMRFER